MPTSQPPTQPTKNLRSFATRIYPRLVQIAAAKDREEALHLTARALSEVEGVGAMLIRQGETYRFAAIADPGTQRKLAVPDLLTIPADELETSLERSGVTIIKDLSGGSKHLSGALTVLHNLGCLSAGMAPVVVSESKVAILLAATRESVSLDKDSLRPLGDLAACLALSLEHLNQIDDLRRGISRAQAVARISQAVSTGREPADVCQAVQQYLAEEIGPSDFLVALYREERGLIEIPYFCKGSQVSSIEPYPLGEGLVSLLIRSGDPLLLEGQTGDYALMMDAAIQEQKAKSWLGVPLKAGANVIGALVIEDLASEGRFNRSDLELLEAIAPQVAFALSHTSLVSQNFKALEKNRRLHQVTHMAISGNSVDDAFAATVKGLQEVMGADHHVSVLLLNEDGTHLDVRAFAGYGALDLTRVSIPLEEGITGMAALQHRPICVADTRSDRRYIAADSRVCSELALPLLYRDQLLGVLNLENDRLDAYTSDDQEMLATLAGSLAAVVANAHLVGQIQRQVDRERLLFEITSKIRRSVDIPSILETSATELGKAVGARRAHIELGIPPGSAEVDHAPESDSGSNGHGSRPEVKA